MENRYIYQYRDHLGNVRISFGRNSAGALEITDANDYYPFGMNHLKSGNAFFGQSTYKNYKYNGKELQETGMDDYGARMYMPDLGRWGVIDPLAEKLRRHTPYNYAVNNPIVNIDPDGMLSKSFIDEMMSKSTGGKTTWTNDGNGNFSDGNGNSVSDGNPPYYRVLMFGGADLDPTGKTSYGQVSSTTKYIANNVKKDNTTVSYENWPYWANSKTKQSIIDGWANTLQEAYNNGDKIALYGYSQGGVGILEMQRALAKRGVPVEILLVVDPANGPKSDEINTYVHWNVKNAYGFYQTNEQTASLRSHGSPLITSPRNSTVVENVNDTGRVFYPPGQTKSSAVNHSNIDEFRRDTVVNLINQLTQKR
ncbi:RHS repeat-associated core domain-containing protein [Chryseobacterium tructae]|uniref:RHS repeat-associated core domain-containing protein n=1 Tax=Chryseobacterium tructae TaxID=1037380 RepID=A0ABV7XX20_9FLAO|nr:RHS repeat-associated core domain-containing protein [Chryseobacterium tructae]MDN3693300.1 RHS repeat-associated core domain-containing protein [Chryseobacterium tructae]